MEFLKTITGKIVSGVVALVVVATLISWFTADPRTRQMLLAGAGRIASWFAIMLLVPWASFFVIGRVARLRSNTAGAVLVGAYTLIEALVLAWLFNWTIAGATAWVFFTAAVLLAGVYNLFACDWIAEKVS